MNPPDPTEALSRLDLPAPERSELLARTGQQVTWRLVFPEGARLRSAILRLGREGAGYEPFAHEAAGIAVARATKIPVTPEHHLLDPDLFGVPAALYAEIEGELPRDAALYAHVVGGLMAQLVSVRHRSFATRAAATGLVRRRGSWPEELWSWAWVWWRAALAAGTDLGPLGHAVAERLHDRLGALSRARYWSLVHLDLNPTNLVVRDGELVGVIDWATAMIADPVLEWLSVLPLPLPLRASVVGAFGRDKALALLDPGGLERLEVYELARCLGRLGVAARSQGEERARHLERARHYSVVAMQGGWARARMEAVLHGRADPPDVPSTSPIDLVTREILVRAACSPAIAPHTVATALARAELGDLAGARSLIAGGRDDAPGEPIADRRGWHARLVHRAMTSESPAAIAVAWLGSRALRRIDVASDTELRALEALVVSAPPGDGAAVVRRVAAAELIPLSVGDTPDPSDEAAVGWVLRRLASTGTR